MECYTNMGNVLIIDDESAICDYLATLIQRLGYKPETAATATEGLAKLKQPSCQIVIADIYLPDSPPPEQWIRQLAQAAAGRKVVLISGAPTQALAACATACGINTFLSKPFELAFIRDIMQETFNKKRDTGQIFTTNKTP